MHIMPAWTHLDRTGTMPGLSLLNDEQPTEGSAATLSGNLAATWTLSNVSWSADNTTTPAISTAGPFTTSNTHANEGTFSITATFTDAVGSTATSTTAADVADAAPAIRSAALASTQV